MPDSLTATIIKDNRVDAQLDAQLRALLYESFPKDNTFRDRRYWKEIPAQRAILRDASGQLAGNVAIHRKILGTSTGDLLIGGIADVCVRKDCRGRGFVRAMLTEVHNFLNKGDYPFAMLFGDRLVYSSSGYVNIDNPIRYVDDDGQQISKVFDYAMIRPIRAQHWPAGEIDLRGPLF